MTPCRWSGVQSGSRASVQVVWGYRRWGIRLKSLRGRVYRGSRFFWPWNFGVSDRLFRFLFFGSEQKATLLVPVVPGQSSLLAARSHSPAYHIALPTIGKSPAQRSRLIAARPLPPSLGPLPVYVRVPYIWHRRFLPKATVTRPLWGWRGRQCFIRNRPASRPFRPILPRIRPPSLTALLALQHR